MPDEAKENCPTCKHPDGIPPEHLALMRANAANPEVRARFAANIAARNAGFPSQQDERGTEALPSHRVLPALSRDARRSEFMRGETSPAAILHDEYDTAPTSTRRTPQTQSPQGHTPDGVMHLRLHAHTDLPHVGTPQVIRQLVPSKGELGEFQARPLFGDADRDLDFDLPKKRPVHRPFFDGLDSDVPRPDPLRFPFGGVTRKPGDTPSPTMPYGPILPVDGKLSPEFRRLLGLPDPAPDPWRPRDGRAEGWHPLDVPRDPLPPFRPGTGALGPWPISPLPPIGLWGGPALAEPQRGFGLSGGLWIKLPGGFRIYVGGSGTFAKRRVLGGWEIGGGIQWRS